jgi:hypothetical protein
LRHRSLSFHPAAFDHRDLPITAPSRPPHCGHSTDAYNIQMLWWDWNARQRLSLLAAILAIAAMPWLLLGWAPNDWGAFVGGTVFLAIPLMIAWALFVGLRTGRMPSAYGRSELRAETPAWFWFTGALYAGLLLFFLWIMSGVLIGGTLWGF